MATSSVEEIAGIPVFIIVPQLSVLILAVPVFCPRHSRALSATLEVLGAYEWSKWGGTGVAECCWSCVKHTRAIPELEWIERWDIWIKQGRKTEIEREVETTFCHKNQSQYLPKASMPLHSFKMVLRSNPVHQWASGGSGGYIEERNWSQGFYNASGAGAGPEVRAP